MSISIPGLKEMFNLLWNIVKVETLESHNGRTEGKNKGWVFKQDI